MKKIIATITIILIFSISGCKSQHEKFAEQGINRMGNLELKKLLKNGWNAKFNIKQVVGTVNYHANGSSTGYWSGSDHTGKWNISDDQFCSDWDARKQRCYFLYQTEPGVFSALNTDGTFRGELKTK
jgi:hypothetical protein